MSKGEELTLIAPGCLGTCWHGKYHYLEPWVGCEHSCAYCYAHCRKAVNDKINNFNSTFEKPIPLYKPEELLKQIDKQIKNFNVKIIKLSRYTDIFSPSFVKNGLSYEVLKVLCKSSVDRIIITTKGVPSYKTIKLIEKYKDKFSYNAAAKPECGIPFELNASPIEERLLAAQKVNQTQALTTIHMDPIAIGIEDEEEILLKFLKKIKSLNLNRIMFSFLLLSDDIIKNMKNSLGEEVVNKVLSYCKVEDTFQCLPNQEETTYISATHKNKKKSIEKISLLLRKMNFEFVLCSIKNDLKRLRVDRSLCNLCDGSFYA